MMDDLFRLDGKVALVTGGSRGLGRRMAEAFALAGADVIVASRKFDACREAASEISALAGGRAEPYACHVGRWNEVDDLAEFAYREFGRVDILVNNAGMSPLYESPAAITEELWDKVLDVNLKGTFRLSAVVGERMVAGSGGSIINVSSLAGSRPTPVEIPYGAAKAGVENLTFSMSRAFAPTVRVNCIAAGPFMTDISKAWDLDEFAKVAESSIALRRGGEPEEIVGTALYLASDASSYLTGAVIPLDGNAR